MKQLYIIDYESSQWCGGQSHVRVWAESADEAKILADDHMETSMRELFSDEYSDEDDECFDEDCAYSINSVEVLDEKNEHWEFFQKSSQAEFYPVINE